LRNSWDLQPTKLSMTAIAEHADLKRTARRIQEDTGTAIPLPSYRQVHDYVLVLKQEPQVRRVREQMPGPLRDRQSPRSFALSIPAPAQLAQVDEHSMELSVVTPDGIPVTRQVHAAVLMCVKTAAIMGAVLALGSLKEEDYMRLVKMALEPKDRLVLQAGCQHPWPCFGKPAVVFHDRGKIFTRRASTAGAGRSARHHYRTSSPLLPFSEGNRRSALPLDDPAL
jgi:hypothetical protein